jgi:UDP-N-acetylmuramyl pentapeptide phosphotransferase/UDP-N-acetylglucosamine-1-phosphate transferase
MLFAGILLILFILEIFYFKAAIHFNITDKPNGRSSHVAPTLRGGGIIFTLSVLLYYVVFGFKYHLFCLGLLAITLISFADDVKHQRRSLRAVIQFLSALLLLYDTGLPLNWIFLWAMGVVIVVGLVNAYNFMDGINGITALYSFTIMASLFFVNRELRVFDEKLLACIALGNLVFTFFNFRTHARCFAGDVGSISMAYILLFFTVKSIVQAANPIFLMFFTLNITDITLTIIQRLYKHENIFEPHRKHLFQYLANEKKIPQLMVSFIYMMIQSIVSAGVILVWKKDPFVQFVFATVVIAMLLVIYGVIKHRILRQLQLNNKAAVPV